MTSEKRMLLYQKDGDIIVATQNNDPFFNYLTTRVFEEVDTTKKGVVLDLGCGSGRNTFEAAKRGLKAIGVDYVGKPIQLARDLQKSSRYKKNITFHTADITKLKKRAYGLVDYIILMEVVEHIENYQKVIDWSYDSLRPGGKILITTPNDPKQWNVFDEYSQHVRRFRIEELDDSLSKFPTRRLTTIGFPFHRLMMATYSSLMRTQNKGHDAGFRRDPLLLSVYNVVGSIVMIIDSMFDTRWGSTIFAVGIK